MAQSMFIFLLMVFPLIQLHAQEENRYFPTGMKWKEIKVAPLFFITIGYDLLSSL